MQCRQIDGSRIVWESAQAPHHRGVTTGFVQNCWGGRPHGIECQNWTVRNQDRSRP
jgi:hypothetical protein